MPEGDTVWLVARRMNDALAGKSLIRSDFRVPALAETDLAGVAVTAVASRGKHLLTRFGNDLTLHTHFRMDGSWHLYRPGETWRGGPDHQVRIVLETDDRVAVGYRLPVIDIVPTSQEGQLVGHLGPDLLNEATWDESVALQRLCADAAREIKPALLDQRNLAGIGNLYATEALFLSGLTPWVLVGDVPDLTALVRRASRLMMANRGHADQTTTGSLRRGDDHWIFERRDCRRCRARVRQALQGEPPFDRISYWCPRCQTGPVPG